MGGDEPTLERALAAARRNLISVGTDQRESQIANTKYRLKYKYQIQMTNKIEIQKYKLK